MPSITLPQIWSASLNSNLSDRKTGPASECAGGAFCCLAMRGAVWQPILMEEETIADPWPSMVTEFELTAVKVIATLGDDRGAIVENIPKLLCWEGRLQSFEPREDGPLSTLEYRFGFSVLEEADPMASASIEGRIVIIGRHANGLELEIRGNGWIGYDEKGNLEGTFDYPPVMICEDDDPDFEDEDQELDYPAFPMPPQFNRAERRVPARFR